MGCNNIPEFQRQTYVFLLLVLILTALFWIPIPWTNNVWSLSYLKQSKNMDSIFLHTEPPPNHPRASIWFARSALKNNDPNLAIILVNPLAEKLDRDALRILGSASFMNDDYELAIQALEQAKDAQSLWSIANYFIERGDIAYAQLSFEAALAANPEPGVDYFTEFLITQKHDIDAAKRVLYQALDGYPDSQYYYDWLFQLGEILKKQGFWEEAINIFKQAAIIRPMAPEPHYALVALYSENGRIDDAYSEIEIAISIDKDRGYGYFAKAHLLAQIGNIKEADYYYSLAIEKTPHQKSWYLERAKNAINIGDLSLAATILADATYLFPDYADAFYEIAWVFHLLGNDADAQRAIKEAILRKKSVPIWYYIRAGEIFEAGGKFEDAISTYKRILELDSDNRTAIKRLEELDGK